MNGIAIETSTEVILTVLMHLKHGMIDAAIASFDTEFTFKDRGIGLEFNDKRQLAEFFNKARELYPDAILETDTILESGDRVITEWMLQFSLLEPFYGGLSRKIRVSVHGASIMRITDGKITDWVDYYDGLTSRRTALASYFQHWTGV